MARRLVIVGGGYVGAELARALDDHATVTLVEEREAFCHAPAMIRAVVAPDLVERALFPYDRLLRKGTVLRARATAVDAGAVTLTDGRTLAADACASRKRKSYRSSSSDWRLATAAVAVAA